MTWIDLRSEEYEKLARYTFRAAWPRGSDSEKRVLFVWGGRGAEVSCCGCIGAEGGQQGWLV